MMGFLSSHLGQRPNGLGGQETSPSTPIYSGEAHGSLTQAKAQPLPSPTPLLLRICLAKPCRSTAAPTTPRRRAAVGAIFLNLSFPLAGSRRRRRLPSRTCVERGGAVRSALVIGDLDHVEYDYIITLQASARDLQVVCRCKLSPLTRCLDELIDGSW